MHNVKELEEAVSSLPDEQYSQFRRWFLNQDWEKWDREIEKDSREGKLEFLIQEAIEAKKNKKLKDF